MSNTVKPLYGSGNQAVTITLASLAASATVGREFTAINNSSSLFDDILMTIWFETGTVSGNKQVLAFLGGTVDGGSNYTDGLTGVDAGFTRTDPPVLIPLRTLPAQTNSKVYKYGPFSLKEAFGGALPDHIAGAIFNDTGAAFSGTSGNNKIVFQGINPQIV